MCCLSLCFLRHYYFVRCLEFLPAALHTRWLSRADVRLARVMMRCTYPVMGYRVANKQLHAFLFQTIPCLRTDSVVGRKMVSIPRVTPRNAITMRYVMWMLSSSCCRLHTLHKQTTFWLDLDHLFHSRSFVAPKALLTNTSTVYRRDTIRTHVRSRTLSVETKSH